MDILGLIDLPLWLVFLVLIASLIYIYGKRPYGLWKQMGIPGPEPTPFVGNGHYMAKKGVLQCLQEWKKTYGEIFGIYFFRHPILIVSDTDFARIILFKEANKFSDRWNLGESGRFLPPEATNNLFMSEGLRWKRIRNIITPTFSSGKLRMMTSYINRSSVRLAENMTEIAKSGKWENAKRVFGAFTLDVIAGTSFSINIVNQKDVESEPFTKHMSSLSDFHPVQVFLLLLAGVFPFLVSLMNPLAQWLNRSTALEFYSAAIKRMMKERRQEDKSAKKRTDFLQLLIDAEADDDMEKNKKLTDPDIEANSTLFFLAGFETTSTTLQFIAYNLARHQHVQEKVYQEIMQVVGEEEPSYENISRLKYVDAVISETLRMFPPVTYLDRKSSEDVTINGVTIPRGTAIYIAIDSVSYDPVHFPEPEKFNPERFVEEPKSVTFLPFGFGPRMCLGMRLAQIELKIALVHALRRVKILETTEYKPKATISALHPVEKPIMMKLESRD